MKLRLAVVGTGMMARMRTDAFLSLKNVEVVGVASKHTHKAKAFANAYNCQFSTTDYRQLVNCQPHILLIEVPHSIQMGIVKWALEYQVHILIGSCMAQNMDELNFIIERSESQNVIVEGGFEARYKEVWKQTKALINNYKLGDICGVQATACWNADPDSWYYSQTQSGGMPFTHMTYAFLNPLSWLLGRPKRLSAFANQKGIQRNDMVNEVSCAVNILYEKNIPCQLFASYIAHQKAPNWRIFIQGTKGAVQVQPGEFGNGNLIFYQNEKVPIHYSFENTEDAFVAQIKAFVKAINNKKHQLLNTPKMCIDNVLVLSAILESIHTADTIDIK